jgi:hypothetical protein
MRPVWWRVYDLIGHRGPCAFCGHRMGAAHRIVDAILERVRAGEPVEQVAADYRLDPDTLTAAVEPR